MSDILEYSENLAKEVGIRLRNGEIGIFPCDTIYGLCAAVSEENAERLYQIKERPQNKSFITLMTKAQINEKGIAVPKDLLDRWPAAFTAIVFAHDNSTIALRVPDDPFLQALLPISGPIFSTSVNFSGSPSLQNAKDIISSFSDRVDFIVRKDNLTQGLSSTLIDATKTPYQIIRQGTYRF